MRNVKRNEIFTVKLDEPAAAGYQWRMLPQKNLEICGVRSEVQDEEAVGGNITKVFFIKAEEVGEYELIFNLIRPWEKNNPVQHYHEHIDVSEDR